MANNYGMVKTYRHDEFDDNGKIVKTEYVKLVYNVMTYVIYQNYTGRDLQADFHKLIANNIDIVNSVSKETREKLDKGLINNSNIAELPEQDLQALMKISNPDTNLFLIDFIASLIATAKYPTRVAYEDIIFEIPLEMLQDESFTNELLDLMKFGLPDKKKVHQAK